MLKNEICDILIQNNFLVKKMQFQNVHTKGVNFPKTQIGKAKLDRICTAALGIFSQRSFFETPILDICKESGIAVGTFYIYFEDKLALYDFLLFNYKIDIITNLQRALEEAHCTTRKEKELAGIRAFIEYIIKNPSAYTIIWGSLSVDPAAFTDYYTSFARSYLKGLEQDKDELKEGLDLLGVAYALMGITNFLGLKVLMEKDYSKENIDNLVEKVLVHFLSGGIFKD